MKSKVYYVMDSMCGWCYGFSDVINKIQEKYKNAYEFYILPGGMWVGENRKRMDNDLGNYIKNHNTRIEKVTGKRFGEGFNKNILENKEILLDSFPSAKALVLIQMLNKDIVFDFLKKIQEAFFIEGKDVSHLEVYTEIAEGFNISKKEFEEKFFSEELVQETFRCFAKVTSMGVSSFPTVVLEEDNNRTMLVQGYSDFEELDRFLKRRV